MTYHVRHLTAYSYARPVTYAQCALRLTPQDGAGQRVLENALTLTPSPSLLTERRGPFGERVVSALIEAPHRKLSILARSSVEVARTTPSRPLQGPPWEVVRDQAFSSGSLAAAAPATFLYPTDMTPIAPTITEFARASFAPERPLIEAAFDLACRIQAQFVYDAKSTLVSTPVLQSFAARRGVCQDFAHIMICGLRGLGLPAAYVSGYLRTRPPPGRPRLAGADATHAWVDLWCGEALGWVGFDPTNALLVANDHIVLAVGRDYSDVAPTAGLVHGAGEQKVSVFVDVMADGEEPATLDGAAPPP